MSALLEQVYCLSGMPTYTFVEPARYNEIKVSIRTPGRCLVIEGPSGIGKTTTVTKVIKDLEKAGALRGAVTTLSARKAADVEYIAALPAMADVGTVIVDDFHRLTDEVKASLSDHMKILADSGDENSKLILIGINKAGQQLVKFASDLGLRIDVFRLEANPDEKVADLITKGEQALHVRIQEKESVVKRAKGSFQIAQLLCHRLCASSQVDSTQQELTTIDLPLDVVVEEVMVDLGRLYKETALAFARGSKLRREGRAPYLHILRWLADGDDWSLDLREALKANPTHRGSIGQVLDKGFLVALLNDPDKKDLFEPHFHFEPSTEILSVEDPKLVFYLKNLIWREFTRQVGFPPSIFKGRYDFAMSFAGADRATAKRLAEILADREVSVFYDEDEQHRILAKNVEEYLGPIYRRDADYVVALLSPAYPTRIWTKFESDNFRERFGSNSVVPIRYRTAQPGFFSEEHEYGGLSFDPDGDVETQLQSIAETLSRRLMLDRQGEDATLAEAFEAEEVEIAR
ncbi:MAG: TIR domain-containing protein [Acidiphilium sp.]